MAPHDFASPRDRVSPGPAPIRHRFLNGRMPLAYSEWPNESAPLAILVHGSRDHARSWDAIASVLSRTYHVIALDLRGHGDSAWSQDGHYNYAAYLSDLDALCAQLGVTERRPVTLIGHSLGAHIALRYAGALPGHVAQLIAIEAVGAPTEIEAYRASMSLDAQLRRWFDDRRATAAIEQRYFPSIAAATERMQARHGFLTPAQARHLTRHGVRRGKGGWRWKYDPFVGIWPFPELSIEEAEGLWRCIRCPTLLIYGDRSWPSSVPERVVRAIAHARELRLAESGHWPQHDALDACLAAITRFLGAPPA